MATEELLGILFHGEEGPWPAGSPLPCRKRGGQRGSPIQTGAGQRNRSLRVYFSRTHMPMCHRLADVALCSPLRTVSSPPQPHADSLKISHIRRQMVFPQVSQNHQVSLPAAATTLFKVFDLLGMGVLISSSCPPHQGTADATTEWAVHLLPGPFRTELSVPRRRRSLPEPQHQWSLETWGDL